jgi:hypothetical protein
MQNLSDLFLELERFIPSLDGWCTTQRACELAALVVGMRPRQTVCIGVWGGRDTMALALAHKYIEYGKVMAIDPWEAAASKESQEGVNAEWWGQQHIHDMVYEKFMAMKSSMGIDPYIEVVRARARTVTPPADIGVLVVDGNHGPEAIVDVDRFGPMVCRGGIAYCDDIQWTGGSVIEAVRRLQGFGFTKMHDRDTGAFFQRTT